MVERLRTFLRHRHPGNLDAIYHGLARTDEVAGFTSRILQGQDMPAGRKVLLILSGALHDIDPERVPDTPARVSATLAHLDADPEARALLADYESRYGFTTAQVKALIMATDFSMIPAEMRTKQDAFAKAASEAFPGEDFGLIWGRRLAFVDQTATYLGPVEEAEKRVRGLALEIRAASGMLGGKGPTDEQILAGTAKFLAVLRQNPEFPILSPDLQSKFAKVQAYFEARQTPEAWTSPAAPAPTRAPPDIERALRYIRSLSGGITLDGRNTDGLLTLYFEEHSIPEGSDRAEAVRRALVPDRAAADDAMSTVGGKSVEEVARDGVFAYVDFFGGQTVRARPGRDPDDRHSQMVFYITRPGRRWRIRGDRQNKDLGRNDSELIDRLKRWLTAGGIPAEDLE